MSHCVWRIPFLGIPNRVPMTSQSTSPSTFILSNQPSYWASLQSRRACLKVSGRLQSRLTVVSSQPQRWSLSLVFQQAVARSVHSCSKKEEWKERSAPYPASGAWGTITWTSVDLGNPTPPALPPAAHTSSLGLVPEVLEFSFLASHLLAG